MSLNVKIFIPAQGVTKMMRFAEQMSVYEATKQIAEKANMGGPDHGLFYPLPDPERPHSMGKWLKRDRTLDSYDVKTGETLEYKKRTEALKINLADGTLKTLLLDTALPVDEMCLEIGEKIQLKHSDEFSLQIQEGEGRFTWLKDLLSIPEQCNTTAQTYFHKRKYWITDVDVDDPIQLHLVYVQLKDEILRGLHPIIKEEVVQFASLMCQVQCEDYKPAVHTTGWLDPAAYLPPDFRGQKSALEKQIFEMWKGFSGTDDRTARFRFVQLCRSMKTYGNTPFRVKERVPNNPKKLNDIILGISAKNIALYDGSTGKMTKEQPLEHLMKWYGTPDTFTLDFGTWEPEPICLVTNEGVSISEMIAGYIDRLMKKMKDQGNVDVDNDDTLGTEETITRVHGKASSSLTSVSTGSKGEPPMMATNDVVAAQKAIEKLISELAANNASASDTPLTPQQRQQQVVAQIKELLQLAEKVDALAKTPEKTQLNKTSQSVAAQVDLLYKAVRMAAASGIDPGGKLIPAAKGVGEALRDLLKAAKNQQENPNDPQAKDALLKALQTAQTALQKLLAASRGVYADEPLKNLFKEMARMVTAEADDMIRTAEKGQGSIPDGVKKQQMMSAKNALSEAEKHFLKVADELAPTMLDPSVKDIIEKAGKTVEQNAMFLSASAKGAGIDAGLGNRIEDASKRLRDALANLLGLQSMPPVDLPQEAVPFTSAAQNLLTNASRVMAAAPEGDTPTVNSALTEIKEAVAVLGMSGKAVLMAQGDPVARERLQNYLKNVIASTKGLLDTASRPRPDPKALQTEAANLREATNGLLADAGKMVALAALYNAAKDAATATTGLVNSAKNAEGKIRDPNQSQPLLDASRGAGDALKNLLAALKKAPESPMNGNAPGNPASPQNPTKGGMGNGNNTPDSRRATAVRRPSMAVAEAMNSTDVSKAADDFAPAALRLAKQSQNASGAMTDGPDRKDLLGHTKGVAEAVKRMLDAKKALQLIKSSADELDALEAIRAAQAELESAMISADTGILRNGQKKDDVLPKLAASIQEIGNHAKQLASAPKTALEKNPNLPPGVPQPTPDEIVGEILRDAGQAARGMVDSAITMAGSLDDRIGQKTLLKCSDDVVRALGNMIRACKSNIMSPNDPNMNKFLMGSGKNLAEALVKLGEAARGNQNERGPKDDAEKKKVIEMEAAAEGELKNVAGNIDKSLAALNKMMEDAKQKSLAEGISPEEIAIREALMEGSGAIAESVAKLVKNAANSQAEFVKLLMDPKTTNAYIRDPSFSKKLIDAARGIAGCLSALIKTTEAAARGENPQGVEAAANNLSAAAKNLVDVSTSDPNSRGQISLRSALQIVTDATRSLVQAVQKAIEFAEENKQVKQAEEFTMSNEMLEEMKLKEEMLRLEKQLSKLKGSTSGGNVGMNKSPSGGNNMGRGTAPGPLRGSPSGGRGGRGGGPVPRG